MPNIFVKADCEIEVDFLEVKLVPEEWNSRKAEKICEDYGHPKCTIDFEIEGPEGPGSSVLFRIEEKDAISGGISVDKSSETKYTFTINGNFKSRIHKDGISLINAGQKPALEGVTRFRQSYTFEDRPTPAFEFSLKSFK